METPATIGRRTTWLRPVAVGSGVLAAVIAIAGLLAALTGVDAGASAFVIAAGLLLFALAAWLLGRRRSALLAGAGSWWIAPLLAVVAMVLIPLLYSGALAYGSASLRWDAATATNYYAEREGGVVVLAAALSLCVALALFAVAMVVTALIDTTKRLRHG